MKKHISSPRFFLRFFWWFIGLIFKSRFDILNLDVAKDKIFTYGDRLFNVVP
jgi:hypothetical protein